MNLDKIQEMWERDAVIDPDNLHDESTSDSRDVVISNSRNL